MLRKADRLRAAEIYARPGFRRNRQHLHSDDIRVIRLALRLLERTAQIHVSTYVLNFLAIALFQLCLLTHFSMTMHQVW